MSDRPRSGLVALAVLVAAGVMAPQAGAKPRKMFTVSLTAAYTEATAETNQSALIPEGCTGTRSNIFRLSASAQISPIRQRLPLLEYGSWNYFVFPASVSGLNPSGTFETAGSFSVEPGGFPTLEGCVFKPEAATASCPLLKSAEQLEESKFSLFPDPRHTSRFLVYDDDHSIIEGRCPGIEPASPSNVLQGEFLTKLRVSAVERLAKHHSLKVTETATVAVAAGGPGASFKDTETLSFTLAVTRVR